MINEQPITTLTAPGHIIPTIAAAFAATLGVPLGLVGWAFAGGVFTLFDAPFPANASKLQRAWQIFVHLGIATTVGATLAPTVADMFIAGMAKIGWQIIDTPIQDIAAALILSILAPDLIRRGRKLIGGDK